MRLARRDVLRLAGLGSAAALLASRHATGESLARSPGDPSGSREARIPAALAARDVTVRARPFLRFVPLALDRTRFGQLEFTGGLELSCDDPRFGGLSALWIGPEGRRLLSLTDHGTWFSARLAYAEGRPFAIEAARLAPMLGPDGTPLTLTRRFDSECLAIAEGVAYVGLERVHEVLRFDISEDGLSARGRPLPGPPGLKELPSNKGLEALGMVPAGPLAGRLVGIAERSSPGDATPTRGFVLTGGFAEFAVSRSDGYDVSDLAFLPDGDMLLLERSFGLFSGIRMRIRRIPAVSLRPGALLDGPVLIEAGMASRIDNMEGLAVHRGPGGETVLTLVSDDNFSALQSTLLLQFRMPTGSA
jgi:hypothetical protein